MPYPPRPRLQPLPQFRGTVTTRPSRELRERLDTFVLEHYTAGRSLRQIAELTDRSHSSNRYILQRHGTAGVLAITRAAALTGPLAASASGRPPAHIHTAPTTPPAPVTARPSAAARRRGVR